MQQSRLSILTITGFVFVFLGFALLELTPHQTLARPPAQEDPAERIYEGARTCTSCHRDVADNHEDSPHDLALSSDEETFLGDFSAESDVLTLTLPGESEPTTLRASDIAYAIGSGRYVQRYLYEVDENEYMVLPIEWNTVAGEWAPFTLDESFPSEAYDWNQNCAYCHTTGLDIETGEWEDDGVQCEACHGPGSEHLNVVDNIRRIPSASDRAALSQSIAYGTDAQLCGQCHTKGTDTATGRPHPTEFIPGGTLLDGSYELVETDDPVHYWQTGHAASPNMQFNEWFASKHAVSVNAMYGRSFFDASCLECHSVEYTRVERVLARIESEEDYDLAEELIFETGLDIGRVSRMEMDEIVTELAIALEVDPETLNPDAPGLPQLLPQLVNIMAEEGTLTESAIIPVNFGSLITEIQASTEDTEVSTATSLSSSVTCATCHSPHRDTSDDEVELPSHLVMEEYALCTDCHNTAKLNTIHYPSQEMFEGQALIPEIDAVPGAHFVSEDGPECATCHMPEVPVEAATRSSHLMQIVSPGQAVDVEALNDSCTACHDAQTGGSMQSLIDDIQHSTEQRLFGIKDAIDDNTVQWVSDAVRFVERDGSFGIHNYAYSTALLSTMEQELGIAVSRPSIELPVEPIYPEIPQPERLETPVGLTGGSLTMLAIGFGIILVAGYVFFFRQREDAE